jgi:hypothetical protein
VTSQQRGEVIVAGMEAGAYDYITKPFKHNELRMRLRAGKRIIELQYALLAASDGIRTLTSGGAHSVSWDPGVIHRILSDTPLWAGKVGLQGSTPQCLINHWSLEQICNSY